MRQLDTIEEGVYAFSLPNGYQVCVEEYDDIEGGLVVAGRKYISEEDLIEMEEILGFPIG